MYPNGLHAQGGSRDSSPECEVRLQGRPAKNTRMFGPGDRSLVMPRLDIRSAVRQPLEALSFAHGTKSTDISWAFAPLSTRSV